MVKFGKISKYRILCPYCGSSESIIEHTNCEVYFNINTGESEIKSRLHVRYFCGNCGKILTPDFIREWGYD